MTPLEYGIVGCVALLVLLMSSMPVAFVMGVVGVVGFAAIVDTPGAAMSMMSAEVLNTFSSKSLTVIPLFVFMGQIAFHSGITRKLFNAAYRWLGPLPGGMAMASVGACTAFGAICGSGPATAATMASVALPEMKRYRYNMELATGCVAAGGSLGMLIPPSVVFICYGILTEQSVGKLFIAGIVPGFLIAALFCLTIYLKCVRKPEMGPRSPAFRWSEKMLSLLGVFETLVLFALVMGGLFAGWFTPTEAAAVGAGGSLIVAAARRTLNRTMLKRALLETVRTSCMVLAIVAGAVVFGRFLAITRIPTELADTLANLPLPGWGIMLLVVAFYLVCGCFVDALALLMLTVPIFYPVVTGLGYDPIWFGVMIVVVTQMGVISPPVGVNVYVVSGTERDVPLHTVFRGALPFLGALVVAAIILTAWPSLTLFLPRLMG